MYKSSLLLFLVLGLASLALPVIQQFRARERLARFFKQDFSNKIVQENSTFRAGGKGLGSNAPINRFDLLDFQVRRISPTASHIELGSIGRIQLYIGPPASIWSSRPTWKIHRVVDEENEPVNKARKEWEDFLASYIVKEYGFAEPERTTEIYTQSEHAAQTKLANGYLQAKYVDEHGNEKSLERFLAPGRSFPEDRRPYDPNDDPSGEKIR